MVGHLVDVAAELGVARLEAVPVQAVAFLDGFPDFLVVSESLVPTPAGGELLLELLVDLARLFAVHADGGTGEVGPAAGHAGRGQVGAEGDGEDGGGHYYFARIVVSRAVPRPIAFARIDLRAT